MYVKVHVTLLTFPVSLHLPITSEACISLAPDAWACRYDKLLPVDRGEAHPGFETYTGSGNEARSV